MDEFDPYYKWLGIPPEEQPPHHYRLLGVRLFEADRDVLSTAADRQMAHLRLYQTGPYSKHSQQLLNELASARLCLLNPDRKKLYDAGLRADSVVSAPQFPTIPPPPASPQFISEPLAAPIAPAFNNPALRSPPMRRRKQRSVLPWVLISVMLVVAIVVILKKQIELRNAYMEQARATQAVPPKPKAGKQTNTLSAEKPASKTEPQIVDAPAVAVPLVATRTVPLAPVEQPVVEPAVTPLEPQVQENEEPPKPDDQADTSKAGPPELGLDQKGKNDRAEEIAAKVQYLLDTAHAAFLRRDGQTVGGQLALAEKHEPKNARIQFLFGMNEALLIHSAAKSNQRFQKCLAMLKRDDSDELMKQAALNNLAIVMTYQGQFTRAFNGWKKAASVKPSHEIIHNLGRLSNLHEKYPGSTISPKITKQVEAFYFDLAKADFTYKHDPQRGWRYLSIIGFDLPEAILGEETCTFCGGNYEVPCPVPGCVQGTLQDGSRAKCKTCGGTGKMRCIYCERGVEKGLNSDD